MIKLSQVYTSAVSKYDHKDVPAPWHDGVVDRESVAKSFKSMLRN